MKASPRFASWLVAAAALAIGGLLWAAPAAASGDNSGDVVVMGGEHDVIKAGQEVTGDLVVIGGSADVYGKVDGDAAAIGGRIYIAPGGHVAGDLVNLGGVIDNESTGATGGHRGTVAPPPPPPIAPPAPLAITSPSPPFFDWGWTWFYLVDALLTIVAFLLFPLLTRQAATNLHDNPVLSGVLGFFSPIIFVVVIIALAITIIGIPLLPLAVIVTIVGYLVGKAAIAAFLGERIFIAARSKSNPLAAVLIGASILFVLCSVTGWVGIVLYFCLAALAIGAALPLVRAIAPKRPPAAMAGPPAPTFSPPVDPAHTGPPAP